ncbi:MAG: type II toxin-antitoxin system VapC family toxin [Candidatus Diapherotrites archaeon]|nr:type II toxin-antitoxin system VapC family toxin [Candidatus Diapherotrites archaeon]
MAFRVLIDTNVYEKLYEYDLDRIYGLIESGRIIVYGCKVVRDELREIPPSVRVNGKSYRNQLLSLYDDLVGKHSLPTESIIEFLAEEYWKEYAGGISKRKIFSDFLIVATASIHKLDIIVSNDGHSMKSNPAIKAYDKSNQVNGFVTPKFVSIEKLV